MKGRKILSAIILLLMTLSLLSCDRHDIFGMANDLTPGAVTTTATPSTGNWIASTGLNKDIVIEFSSSIDTATLQLEGTLGGEADAAWTERSRENDTLTLTPAAAWTIGADLTMKVNCTSIEGTSITLDLNYNVAGTLRYVSVSSSAANETGTRDEPFKDIQSTIGNMNGTIYPGVILVAAGNYEKAGTVVTIEYNLSLYGGYSASDWDVRDVQNHVTVLRDTRTTVENSDIIDTGLGTYKGSAAYPFRTVEIITTSVSRDTLLDGFSIYAASLTTNNIDVITKNSIASTAIRIEEGSPTISNNYISGNTNYTTGNVNINSSGLDITGVNNALISGNYITGGSRTETNPSGTTSHGMVIASNPSVSTCTEITGNEIHGGAGTESKAVAIQAASPKITNNSSITAQAVTNAYGFHITGDSSTEISGNTISNISGSSAARGIQIESSSTPSISFNYISDLTAPTTYGIRIDASTAPNITDNTISNLSGTATIYGIEINNSSPTISKNTINGLNAPTIIGMKVSTISSPVISSPMILENTISGLSGSTVTGIFSDASTPGITSNIIKELTAPSIYAIQVSNADGVNIVTNTIETLNGELVYGIDINTSPLITLDTNTIRDLNRTSGNLDVCGIHLAGATTVADIAANVITSFDGNTAGITYGIYDSSTTSNITENKINGFKGYEIHGIYFSNTTTSTANKNEIADLNASTRVSGIKVHTNAIPKIKANIIGTFTGNDVNGIFINNGNDTAAVEILNNVIHAGSGTSEGSGTKGIWIYTDVTNVHIRNNTINGGGVGLFTNMTNTAIELRNGGAAAWLKVAIENNHLFTDNTADNSYGIYEYPDNSNHKSYPTSVRNNNIFNCAILYSDIADEIETTTHIDKTDKDAVNDINEGTDSMQYNLNISENIYGADFTWGNLFHYDGDINLWSFDTSGLNGVTEGWGWDEWVDRIGAVRTSTGQWSIGACVYP